MRIVFMLTVLLSSINLQSQHLFASSMFSSNITVYNFEFKDKEQQWVLIEKTNSHQLNFVKDFNSANCDVVFNSYSVEEVNNAFKKILDNIQEGACQVKIALSQIDSEKSYTICIKFTSIKSKRNRDFIADELWKDPLNY